jgi:hypothetical protein
VVFRRTFATTLMGGAVALAIAIAPMAKANIRPTSTGHGVWLHRSTVRMAHPANNGATVAHPSSFRWTPAVPSDVNFLMYADDPYHPSPNTYTDQALQSLGYAYTAHYDADFAGFDADLGKGGWTGVIFADENWAPDSATLRKLNRFVVFYQGKLTFESWAVNQDPNNQLYKTLGFHRIADDYDPPDPTYSWDPSDPEFSVPDVVPDYTDLISGIYGVYGQRGASVAPSFLHLAGKTTTPTAKQLALVRGNDDRTIFKGYLDGMNEADLNGDGILDGVATWVDIAYGMVNGF